MSTIANLQVKIGADGSQVSRELTKTQQAINNAFSTSPIDNFANSIEGSTKKLDSFVWNLKAVVGLAAGGFGLDKLIGDAVRAGESIYALTQQYNMSAKEALEMSHVLSITGGDAETAAKSIMRLDKTFTENSLEGQKAKATMQAYGVSITDAQGNMLPLNQQLEHLAEGYREATKNGEGQAFLMNTLGARGLGLAKTLLEYKDAAEAAAKIQPIELNPEQLHKINIEMEAAKAQAEQIGIGISAAFAPLVMELLPQIIPYLKDATTYIQQNKEAIADMVVDAAKFIALYEGIKLARAGVEGTINTVNAVRNIFPTQNNAEESPLTKTQNRQINSAVKDSDKTYAKMRKEAIATAQQQKMSAEETQAFLSKKFTEIGVAASAAAEQIRSEMTAAFTAANIESEKNAAIINGSLTKTEIAIEEATAAHATANAQKTGNNAAVILSNNEVSASETKTGIAAEEAAAIHQQANAEKINSNQLVTASNIETGNAAKTGAAETVAANITATGGINKTEEATKTLTKAHIENGNAGVSGARKISQEMSKLPNVISKVTLAVQALTGGWLGAAITTAYATYQVYEYQKAIASKKKSYTYTVDGVQYTTTDGTDVEYANSNDAVTRDPTGTGSIDNATKTAVQNKWIDEQNLLSETNKAIKKQRDEEELAKITDQTKKLTDINNMELPKKGKEESYDIRSGAVYGAEQYANEDYGTGENQVVCTTYIENAWANAGVSNAYDLGGWAPNWAANAGSAFHPLDANGAGNYTPKPGDAIITENGGHVIMVGANGSGYFAAAGKGRLSGYYSEDWRDAFAGNIVGAVSLTEFAGVNDEGKTLSDKERYEIIQRRVKEIQDAKKQLTAITEELKRADLGDTGTKYESDMEKVTESAKKYQDEINKIKNVSDKIDVSQAQNALSQFKTDEIDKVTQAWRERWAKLKTDIAQINSGMLADHKSLVDAEYQQAVFAIENERKARLKDIEQSGGDVKARIAVNTLTAAKLMEAQQTQRKGTQESYGKDIQSAIDNRDTTKLQSLMSGADRYTGETDRYEGSQDWDAKKDAMQEYYKLWDQSNINSMKLTTQAAESFSGGLSSIFGELGTNINSVSKYLQSLGNLVLSTITNIVAKSAASRITESLLGGILSGGNSSGFSYSANYATGYSSFASGIVDQAARSSLLSGLKFASGGIVTAPTLGLIGEGKDSEAVLPLNTNTFSALAGKITQNMGGKGNPPVININNNGGGSVKLDNSTWDNENQRYQFDFTVDGILSNQGGSLDKIKEALGG